jgi:hypothetical protein
MDNKIKGPSEIIDKPTQLIKCIDVLFDETLKNPSEVWECKDIKTGKKFKLLVKGKLYKQSRKLKPPFVICYSNKPFPKKSVISYD